jgi:hypothetical protein
MSHWLLRLRLALSIENDSLRADLSDAIDRVNDFVVANSPSPASKAELEQAAASRRENVLKLCPANSSLGEMLKAFGSMSHDKLMSSVADLLSVPRPPVMNPCL